MTAAQITLILLIFLEYLVGMILSWDVNIFCAFKLTLITLCYFDFSQTFLYIFIAKSAELFTNVYHQNGKVHCNLKCSETYQGVASNILELFDRRIVPEKVCNC